MILMDKAEQPAASFPPTPSFLRPHYPCPPKCRLSLVQPPPLPARPALQTQSLSTRLIPRQKCSTQPMGGSSVLPTSVAVFLHSMTLRGRRMRPLSFTQETLASSVSILDTAVSP